MDVNRNIISMDVNHMQIDSLPDIFMFRIHSLYVGNNMISQIFSQCLVLTSEKIETEL